MCKPPLLYSTPTNSTPHSQCGFHIRIVVESMVSRLITENSSKNRLRLIPMSCYDISAMTNTTQHVITTVCHDEEDRTERHSDPLAFHYIKSTPCLFKERLAVVSAIFQCGLLIPNRKEVVWLGGLAARGSRHQRVFLELKPSLEVSLLQSSTSTLLHHGSWY